MFLHVFFCKNYIKFYIKKALGYLSKAFTLSINGALKCKPGVTILSCLSELRTTLPKRVTIPTVPSLTTYKLLKPIKPRTKTL